MRKEDKVVRPSRAEALRQFLGPRLRRHGLYLAEDDYWYPSQQIRTKPKFLWMARGHRVARFDWDTQVVVERLKYYDALANVFSEWEEYWGEEITLRKQIVRRPAEDPDNQMSVPSISSTIRAWHNLLKSEAPRCEYCGRLFEGDKTACVGCGAPR